MRKWFLRLLVFSTLTIGLMVGPMTPVSANDSSLSAVREANSQFHSLAAARHAGYAPLLPCFDLPGVGGMGQHYVKTALLNGKVEALHPQAMVYEVDEGQLKLVAVEYIIPFTMWESATPPTLFGHTFTHNTTLGLWALHAWLWRTNPLGTFANYNPNVKMCPGRQA
jgi:hypothetical protein